MSKININFKQSYPEIDAMNGNNRTTSAECQCQALLQIQNVEKGEMIHKNRPKQTAIKIVPIKTGNHGNQLHKKGRPINSSAILNGAKYS